MATENATSLPLQPALGGVRPVAAGLVAAFFVASQKDARCPAEAAVAALAAICDGGTAIASALAEKTLGKGAGVLIADTRRLREIVPGLNLKGGWAKVRREIAFHALGAATGSGETKTMWKRDLAASVLRLIYELHGLPEHPSRGEVRVALLAKLAGAFGGGFHAAAAMPLTAFALDPFSRRMYFAIAGTGSGTVVQADAALLRAAFGFEGPIASELAPAVIRHAVRMHAVPVAAGTNIDGFAASVQKLAATLETKPYAGRVAIAQVYDAGVQKGLSLGSLDEFKDTLAKAAREGLLDLERYDIAGPFDAALKERSRLRFGRDERHFIVNQWN